MHKIINGKRYNTMTAKKLGTSSSEFPSSDNNWWEETLYQKQTGEYFLYAEGGPKTKYRSHDGGNSWGYGKEIIPIDTTEAREWAKNSLSAETYEKVFGEAAGDGNRKLVTFSLSEVSINKLGRMAAETKKTKSDIVDSLIKEK